MVNNYVLGIEQVGHEEKKYTCFLHIVPGIFLFARFQVHTESCARISKKI